jgi:adenylosuccinate lyase
MIPRYSTEAITNIFKDESKYSTWLEVELAAVKAWAKMGKLSDVEADLIANAADFTVEEIEEREEIIHHDLAAFVDVAQGYIRKNLESQGENVDLANWFHFGLTSSDIGDNAWSLNTVRALRVILENLDNLISACKNLGQKHINTICIGRTHGIQAELTTFGYKVCLWYLSLSRAKVQLEEALKSISVGKFSGAVGTYSQTSIEFENIACGNLDLTPVPSTQVIDRDHHLDVMYACVKTGVAIEHIALEIRHLQRTEVSEVFEPFAKGKQKGSSAMPHKRNPVKCEQLCGIARVIRSNFAPAAENVSLWHERDISHSSVERVIIPDTFEAINYMILNSTKILDGLVVNSDRMRENINNANGLFWSQTILTKLLGLGFSRDEAYRIVQSCSVNAFETKKNLVDLVKSELKKTYDKEFDWEYTDNEELFLKEIIEKSAEILDK